MAATNETVVPRFSLWVDDGDEWICSSTTPPTLLEVVATDLEAAGFPLKKPFAPKGERFGCKFKKFPSRRGVWAGPLGVAVTTIVREGYVILGGGHYKAHPQIHFAARDDVVNARAAGAPQQQGAGDDPESDAPPAYDEASAPDGEDKASEADGNDKGKGKGKGKGGGLLGRVKAKKTQAKALAMGGASGVLSVTQSAAVDDIPEVLPPFPPVDATYYCVSAQHEQIIVSGTMPADMIAVLTEALSGEGLPLAQGFEHSKNGALWIAKVEKQWTFEKKASASDAVAGLASALVSAGLIVDALAFEYLLFVRERAPTDPAPAPMCAFAVSGKGFFFKSANLPFEVHETVRQMLTPSIPGWDPLPTGGAQLAAPEGFVKLDTENQGITVCLMLVLRIFRSFVSCKTLLGGDDNYMLFLAPMNGSHVPLSDPRLAINITHKLVRISPCNEMVQTAMAEALVAVGHEIDQGTEVTGYPGIRVRMSGPYSSGADDSSVFVKRKIGNNKYNLIGAEEVVLQTMHRLGYVFEAAHHGIHKVTKFWTGTDGKSHVKVTKFDEAVLVLRQTEHVGANPLVPAAGRGVLSAPKTEKDLPDGWEKKTNPANNSVFYLNTVTGESQTAFPSA